MSDFESWHTADPDAAGGDDTLDPPADGTYHVALVEGSAFETKDGQKSFVKTTFKVLAGPSADYQWTVLHGFKSQAQANITKKTCRELGVDIDNVTSLQALNDAVVARVGHYFTVTVKTNGQYRNTYIDGDAQPQGDLPVETGEKFAPDPVPAGATAEADIPF